jgi:hypothetical protein
MRLDLFLHELAERILDQPLAFIKFKRHGSLSFLSTHLTRADRRRHCFKFQGGIILSLSHAQIKCGESPLTGDASHLFPDEDRLGGMAGIIGLSQGDGLSFFSFFD